MSGSRAGWSGWCCCAGRRGRTSSPRATTTIICAAASMRPGVPWSATTPASGRGLAAYRERDRGDAARRQPAAGDPARRAGALVPAPCHRVAGGDRGDRGAAGRRPLRLSRGRPRPASGGCASCWTGSTIRAASGPTPRPTTSRARSRTTGTRIWASWSHAVMAGTTWPGPRSISRASRCDRRAGV